MPVFESTPDAVAIVYVRYRGSSESRFDRNYYVDHHLPLVMQAWGPYGLEDIAAFFPAIAGSGTLAICECRFRSAASIDVALRSPATREC